MKKNSSERGRILMDNRPIGVFDSGLGGLTVVKEIMSCLPRENIVYFGDTARIPYGTRSSETVIKYSIQCIRFLISQGIKMVVIACNTASSTSLEVVQKMFDIPIIGVIEPGAQGVVKATKNGRVGVIGTEGTIRSGAYVRAIHSKNPDIKIYSTACTLFVPLAEEGWGDTEIAFLTAQKYLCSMNKENIDTMVLGCTHYPLLINAIRKAVGDNVKLVNPAEETAREVKRVLEQNDMLNQQQREAEYSFFVSDFGQKFKEIGSRFLGKNIELAKKVDIEKY